MKNNLLFDFTLDKENSTVYVKREFDAPQSNVWAAWTEPELLDQWWAPETNFKALDGFCDDQGNLNPDMPRSDWNVDFTGSNRATTVIVRIKHNTLADLEKHLEMGFKEGFTVCLEELTRLLASMNK